MMANLTNHFLFKWLILLLTLNKTFPLNPTIILSMLTLFHDKSVIKLLSKWYYYLNFLITIEQVP